MGSVKDVKLPVRMGFVETRCDADQTPTIRQTVQGVHSSRV